MYLYTCLPARLLPQRVPHLLRIETIHLTPEFFALRVEENKSGREFKTVNRREVFADLFLNVEADENHAVAKFLFESVNDGLYGGAGNSVGRLEFEQDGLARADPRLHVFCVACQRGLNGVQYDPRRDESRDNHPEGEKIPPGRFFRQQDESRHADQSEGNEDKRILVERWGQGNLLRLNVIAYL